MRGCGKGNFQGILRKITEIQIIYALLERPYTYGELREKTKIQGTTLSKILKDFKDKDMIIRHKLSIDKNKLNETDDEIIAVGLYYHMLKLNNLNVQRYIADPTPLYLEEYINDPEQSTDEDIKKYDNKIINKLKSLSVLINAFDYTTKEIIDDVDNEAKKNLLSRKNTDMHEAERKSRDEKNKKFKEIIENADIDNLLKGFKNLTDNTKYEYNKITLNLKPLFLKHMEEFVGNDTKELDFFIFTCCKTCNSDNYLENAYMYRLIWKMFEQNIFYDKQRKS